MLSLYMREIDKSLGVVDTYLTSMANTNDDLISLDTENDPDYRMMIKVNLSIKLTKDIASYKNIDGIFIYNSSGDDFLYDTNSTGSPQEKDAIKSYIIDTAKYDIPAGELYLKGWSAIKINDQYYLFRIIRTFNNYIGAWVNVQKLLIPLNLINLGQGGASMITTENGIVMATSNSIKDESIDLNKSLTNYYLTGEKNQFLVVGQKSSKGKFNLIALIPDKKILENLPYLQRIVTFIIIAAILLFPVCFMLLRKVVLSPINRLLNAMEKIEDGDIETRLKEYKTSDEFKILNNTFNNMIDQIHELRISIYEEQLSKQKAELERLQLQVNPHFFLNSLNIIYRLAQTEKYGLIQEMSLCLLQYFRYMFRNNMAFVTLGDELNHVRNYIRIQELRFPDNFTYDITVPDFLLNSPVPPLVIQNFVENSIKYAVSLDEPVHLGISIEYVHHDQKPQFEIVIKDTGKGFPDGILKDLQAGKKIIDHRGEHIGIWNVQRRLQLLYSGEASISFSNNEPSGAVVKISLPIKHAEQQEGDLIG